METTHSILFHKLLVILHRGLVQARDLARAKNCPQLHDLADTLELLPELMTHWKEDDLDRIRDILADYQGKYPGTAYDYLAILDMEEALFRAVYQLPEEAEVGPRQNPLRG